MNTSFLERLGIYGYSHSHERAIHASVLTGSPLLLLGTIGEAKSLVAKALARLILGNKELGQPDPFQKIAADKVNIDDLTGYLDIPGMKEGKVQFLPSPMSIWNKNFLLIDEISRATPKIQNRLLEIIYERELQGLPTDVRWTFATMNPLDQTGSQPLDAALAGRFAYVLVLTPLVKHSGNREEMLRKAVMINDATLTPALAYWDGKDLEGNSFYVSEELRTQYDTFMSNSRNLYKQLMETWSEPVAKYAVSLAISLAEKSSMTLDTRRISMIVKNIIANLAVGTAMQTNALDMSEIKALVNEVVLLSLPWAAQGLQDVSIPSITAAHRIAADFLDKGDSLIYRVITERDALKKAMIVLKHRDDISSSYSSSLINSLYDPINKLDTKEDTWKAEAEQYALALSLGQLALSIDGFAPDLITTIATKYPIKRNSIEIEKLVNRIRVTTYSDYRELVEFVTLNIQSNSPSKQAALYFSLTRSAWKASYSSADIKARYDLALSEIKRVTQALRSFLPMKVNINVPSGSSFSPSDANTDAQSPTGSSPFPNTGPAQGITAALNGSSLIV